MNKQCKFTIGGHVQGVGFRFFVYRRAIELNLTGYVKNLFNGNVEVVAEGEEYNIDELHKHLKAGPSRSYVDYVHAEYYEFTGEYSRFVIE
ncbi:MAG: acylphosphatase [bacterium]